MVLIKYNNLQLYRISTILNTMDSNGKQKIISIMRQLGVVNTSDIVEQGLRKSDLYELVKEGDVRKMARGVFCLSDYKISQYENLLIISKTYPSSVFCLLTALDYYGITTQIPSDVWCAFPHGTSPRSMQYPLIEPIFLNKKYYSMGLNHVDIDGMPVKIYSIEKTLCDCFRFRSKVGINIAIEALKSAKEQNLIETQTLFKYVLECRIKSVINPYLEAIL